jgi:GNAT superfamily N-acetyltransferase
VDVVDLPEFGADDLAEIVDGESDPWETQHLAIEWRVKTVHVGLMDRGRLIGHAGWVPAEARGRNGEVVSVAGLGGVIIHRDHRGNGAGVELVSGAMRSMAGGGAPLGLLFCRPERLAFYQRLGWIPLDGVVTADQPSGPIAVPMPACWTPLVEGSTLTATGLRLEGLPF